MRSRLLVLLAGGIVGIAGCSAGHPAAPSASPATSAAATAPAHLAPLTAPRPTAPPRMTHSVSDLPLGPLPALARPTSEAPSQSRTPGLPLPFGTGDADQLITVVAPSTSSTTATLQAWQRSATGWQRFGGAVPAWVGSDGLSTTPSESISATPIGSFTLTTAFGHDANPGTALPYVQTTPDDWWISQEGPLYNTRQRCASNCPFNRGDPNEHLYYETPYYDYAVVIDYNTPDAPGGVRQGAGSAFFLHVTDESPTAGCVSIAADQLVRIMDWLSPSQHPRILIGVGAAG